MPDHKNPYSDPEIYELAFSWRDYPKVVRFITEAARQAGLENISSMAELGCGPGQYCRQFARQSVKSYGLDLSDEMVAYASAACEKEKLDCHLIHGDMRSFKLPQVVDLAVCMMATIGYLLTNRDILDHFDAVAENLKPDGLYLIELPHPRDIFGEGKSTKNAWEINSDNLKVKIDWCTDAIFDPLDETDFGTVRINFERDGQPGVIEAKERTRRVNLGLIRSLIQLSGRFKIVSMFGDLDINQTFDNSEKSWRMILLLRKHS